MKVVKNDLGKSQIELKVELSVEEMESYIKRGVKSVSREVKIDGFRPGNAPYDVLKQKIGEMTILEEAANIAIQSTINNAMKENITGQPIGQPNVEITKLAPGNPLEYKVIVALIPEIKITDYKNFKIKQKRAETKDEETEKMLTELREMKAQEILVEREVRDNDKVLVDIQMFLDQVPIEGGQSQNAAIIIGKDYVIPGFDKKLIGAAKLETREFSLPYPTDHHMKNIAGKMVEFKITVKEIYERRLPDLNDDFANGFGCKKISELQENIKKSIIAQAEKENEQQAEKEMLEKIIAKAKYGDIPEMLIKEEGNAMLAELEQGVIRQGGRFADYLASVNKSRDQLMLDLLPDAVKRVKASLLIREIANLEKIKVSGEEIEEHLQEMKKHYKNNSEILKKISLPEYKHYVYNVLTSRKVIDKLREWNIEK